MTGQEPERPPASVSGVLTRPILVAWLAALVLAVPATTASAADLPCRGFCVKPATALTAETKTLRAGDVTIGYRTFGSGRTLLLIPGFAQGMDQWDPEFLDALAKRHRVVVFDGQGVGRSTQSDDDLTVARMMTDTARLITGLKLKRPDVLGWSLGGMVAQELAIQRPDLVRRLVLAATSPGTPRATPPTQEALAIATKPDTTAEGRLPLLFPAARNNVRQSYFGRILKRPAIAVPATSVIARQLSAMTAYLADPKAALPRLGKLSKRTRVLVADGSQDIVLPQANSRLIAKAVKGSQLVVYPGAGHGFLFSERARFAPRVLRFLR